MKINFLKQKNKKLKNGFTLVETMVAIFILLLSITGPMAVAQSGLRSAFIARDQVTAFYLAQDAIEYITNIRDKNFIDQFKNPNPSANWLAGLNDCVDSDSNITCTIDTTKTDLTAAIRRCSNGVVGCSQNFPLKKNVDNQFVFGSATDTNSSFYRTINIREIQGASSGVKEAQITVTVGWTPINSSTEREIVIQENIFRWAPLY